MEKLTKNDTSNLTMVDRIYGLSLLWREVFYNFAFFDRQPDLNWNAHYKQFLSQAIEANDTFEYYRVLAKFMVRLNDGHSGILYPQNVLAASIDFPPVCLQQINGLAVVVAVEEALSDSLPLGSCLIAIDRKRVEDHLREEVLPYIFACSEEARQEIAVRGLRMFGAGLLAGAPGSTARLLIKTPQNEEREVMVTRNLADRTVNWVGKQNLLLQTELLQFKWLEDRVAYVALNSFMDVAIVKQFETIKPDLLKARALILDLRVNTGGNSDNGVAILTHFSEGDLVGSRSRTRQTTAARRAWGQFGGEHPPIAPSDNWVEFDPWVVPESPGDKITVPTAVLIGRGTISAAEDFLVMADSIPHFTTIGSPTYGSTGQPLFFDLPGGGLGFVVTKHDSYPDGREFVGPGVKPKIQVTYRLEDIASGIDVDLEEALRFLKQR